MSDLVVATTDGAIRSLTLCRVDQRNALNHDLRAQLTAGLREAASDPSVRVVVLRGEGDHFCAGADIRDLGKRTGSESAWTDTRLDEEVERLGKPSIAALHGYTLGGGLELSLACTLRVVANDLVAGLPEIKLGIFPALGGTQRLTRMVGESLALSLVLSGRTFGADEAMTWGLATRRADPAELDEAVNELAESLARRPPVALRAAIDSVHKASSMSRQDGLDFERAMFGVVCSTEDKDEGVAAWLEQRDPNFRGR